MKLMTGFDSNYRYILVAARRARQLQNGARPTIETDTKKACRVAQQEVDAGNIAWYIPEPRAAAPEAKTEPETPGTETQNS